jgi:hypothetical protein
MDSTAGADVSSTLLTNTATYPLDFVQGRFSVENSLGSLTSSSYWNVQGFSFKLSNGLKSDNDSRAIGSDVLQVLPQGVARFELSAKMRFDTTTAYDAMLAGSQLSAEFQFLGATLAGSANRQSIKLTFPKVYIKDAGDPEIGGPEEILVSEISFDVLRDASSATGYPVKITVVNGTAAY